MLDKRTIVYGLGALLIVSGLATGLGSVGERDAGIEPGDRVAFHMSALDETGKVVFTTNKTLALEERARGNDALPNESGHFGVLNMTVNELFETNKSGPDPNLFLLGAQEGDTVTTLLIKEPFGPPPTLALDHVIAPVATAFAYNFSEVENSTELVVPVEPSELTVGMTAEYAGGMVARVVAIQGDRINFELDLPSENLDLFSGVFGFNMTIHELDGGNVSIHPQLEVGETFQTQGCALPGNVLSPGTYTVTGVTDEHYTLAPDLGMAEELFFEPVRFEFEVLSVEKPGFWASLVP